jgi:hypothetical protein
MTGEFRRRTDNPPTNRHALQVFEPVSNRGRFAPWSNLISCKHQ